MKITKIYLFPIKSLRPISLPKATLCPQGLAYDRRYILLKVLPNGTYQSMFVGTEPEMALFHCKLASSTTFSVEYHAPTACTTPPTPSQQTTIEIPLDPASTVLGETINIKLHTNPNHPARRMPDEINKWFSECFGYECVLAYIGDKLGVKQGTDKEKSWMPTVKAVAPKLVNSVQFSDGAALLVTSESSMPDLHTRLPDGENAVMEKFRPNIVIDGDGEPWAEDFWGELTLPRLGGRIVLTSNCMRCLSINVDLDKGRMGEGESGKMLKKMMKDRRIDPGSKWEPVFGRYGFPTKGGEVQVGDEVILTKRNDEYTVWNGILPRFTKMEDDVNDGVTNSWLGAAWQMLAGTASSENRGISPAPPSVSIGALRG